ncbi:TetR-like C-terminal domain-containing protein [Streptomyces sp. NPDC000410]|uniref:TetR-like C-terminal domain-containing protein n=1 Tax=Streptomyces sp. NPDC000410 TaxID=3154254 RepID=UPI003316F4A9
MRLRDRPGEPDGQGGQRADDRRRDERAGDGDRVDDGSSEERAERDGQVEHRTGGRQRGQQEGQHGHDEQAATDLVLLDDAIAAPLWYRLLVSGEPLTAEYADRIVEGSLSAALAHKPQP